MRGQQNARVSAEFPELQRPVCTGTYRCQIWLNVAANSEHYSRAVKNIVTVQQFYGHQNEFIVLQYSQTATYVC